MARTSRIVWVLLAFTIHLVAPAARAKEPVDLLLVLAADVSRSVDQAKFQLQREGYAAAISHPEVLKAVTSGPHRRIALCFVEWSGAASQAVLINWMLIGDAAAARAFGDQLIEAPRSFADRTSISAALDFSVPLFEGAPFEAERHVIDVSGDGTNNAGRDVTAARDDALARGIIINGLVILTETPLPWNPEHTNPPGGLEAYYRANVIGGPDAFVIAAQNFESFGEAIIKKMVREIASLSGPRHAAMPR
ncbi:DUF1194 domain-containing protein [Vineibacter terrae]|uniref:DUF1194 domain-containing protein n=1 Tax=Vineibacter terrae TaxID=2586908 RepID=UPI002E322F4D|nr:DUF1194 domain-containing protein [Vineibacter terrae]HEX2884944.1 DUF1194 domain-containing protein [Vineibacter terrae]